MYHYTARIICDKCKLALIVEAGSKASLFSMKALRRMAKADGWYVNKQKCLCEMCYEKERGK